MHPFFSKQARKKWERRLAGGLSQDSDRNREQALGIVQSRDIAYAAGSKVAQDPVVGGDQRHSEHQRDRELDPFPKRRIAHVERNLIAGPDACRADRVNQEWP